MKAIKFSSFAIFLIGMFLISCKKETNVAVKSESLNKYFTRTLKVYNENNSNSVTLRFKSLSEERLARMPLERFQFLLVKAPASMPDNSDVLIPAGSNSKFKLLQKDQKPNGGDNLLKDDKLIYVDKMKTSEVVISNHI